MAQSNSTRTVQAFLERLSSQAFFGSVTLKYERGTIVHVRKEENLKPSELSGAPESKFEHSPR